MMLVIAIPALCLRLMIDKALRQDDSDPCLLACALESDTLLHRSGVEMIFSLQTYSVESVFVPMPQMLSRKIFVLQNSLTYP